MKAACDISRVEFAHGLADKSISRIFSWLILVVASAYLVYKLSSIGQYRGIAAEMEQVPLVHFGWLIIVLLLLPANWYFESLKWKLTVSKIQKVTFHESVLAILAGFSIGFLTPNRVGEIVGRVMFLNKNNRKPAIVLASINSITQNFIILLFGLPAAILFLIFVQKGTYSGYQTYYVLLSALMLVMLIVYFALPAIAANISWKKVESYTHALTLFSKNDLSVFLIISLFRFAIFCIQFFFMLHFFNVILAVREALIAIPASYLFVTFTPSFAFSELAVRSSYAVFFIGAFSAQTAGIAFAGICLWLINFGIPVLVGSIVLSVQKSLHLKNDITLFRNDIKFH